MSHGKSFHRWQIYAHGSFKVDVCHLILEVVDEFSSVDVKAFLIGLVGNTIFDLRAKHHLVAAHKIKHDIFQCGLKSLWVNQVEINEVIGGDLDSFVSFDEVNESTNL